MKLELVVDNEFEATRQRREMKALKLVAYDHADQQNVLHPANREIFLQGFLAACAVASMACHAKHVKLTMSDLVEAAIG